MKKAALAIAAACLIAAPLSFAHDWNTNSSERSMPKANIESQINNRVDYLTTVLSLTTAQQQQARNIFTNAENKNVAVFADLRTEREVLRKDVNSNEPSNAIAKVSDAIGNDVSKLVVNEASATEQLRSCLNPEQQTKLAQLQRETHGWAMGMGFHGAMPFEG